MLRAVLLLILLASPFALAAGESLGVTPARVEIAAAQRGESYAREVFVQNGFDSPTTVTLERSGESGEWLQGDLAPVLLPPRATQAIPLVLRVPQDADNGRHEGALRIVAEPKAQPTGSGMALRYAVAVPLAIDVGGERSLVLRFAEAGAPSIEEGTPPQASLLVRNEGNVRATARATAEVLPLAGGEAIAQAQGSAVVLPGASATIALPFDAPLPQGQYVVRIRSEPEGAFDETLEFKVLAPGSLDKSGVLRYLEHVTRAEPGLPVKIVGVFDNTGAATLGRAQLRGEVYLEETLVGTFESADRVVRPGETSNLTAFFTPTRSGLHQILAVVEYDGFESLPSEGILAVAGSSSGGSPAGAFAAPWAWGALVAAVAVGALVLAHRARR